MWHFNQVASKNFITYKEMEFDFRSKATIITGLNLTDEGQRGNGSGKSALIECIIVGLTGSPFRSKSLKEVIMDGEKECEITLTLSNSITKDVLKIVRIVSTKKSASVQLIQNNITRDDLTHLHPRETDKEIERLVGISFDDIRNYYILSIDHHRPFFMETDMKKKSIINRFSKAEIVDTCSASVDVDIEDLRKKILQINTQITSSESSIELHQSNIRDWKEIQNNKPTDKERREALLGKQQAIIDRLNEDVQWIEKRLILNDNQLQDSLRETHNELPSILKSIEEYNGKLHSLTQEYNDVEKERSEYQVQLTQHAKEIRSLTILLAGELTCPSCEHNWVPQSEITPEEARQKIQLCQQSSESLQSDVNSCEHDKLEIKGETREVEMKISDWQREKKQVEALNSLRDTLKQSKTSLQQQKKGIDDSLTRAKQSLEEIRINELSEEEDVYVSEIQKATLNIESLMQQVANCRLQHKELLAKEDKYNQWKIRFKQFKSHLANQAIGSIEGYTNYYLQQMNTNLQVKIDGMRMLADNKTMKDEITIVVLRDRGGEKVFERFSGGEKARINIANILAIQQMINDTSSVGGLNFLALDEICESLDELGVSNVTSFLSTLGRCTMMINQKRIGSHEIEEVIVAKIDGLSRIGTMQFNDNKEEVFVPLN